jgi:type I restriction enzyme S subunit
MKTGWEISNFENEFMFQEGPGVRNWQFTETGIKLLNVANIEKNWISKSCKNVASLII